MRKTILLVALWALTFCLVMGARSLSAGRAKEPAGRGSVDQLFALQRESGEALVEPSREFMEGISTEILGTSGDLLRACRDHALVGLDDDSGYFEVSYLAQSTSTDYTGSVGMSLSHLIDVRIERSTVKLDAESSDCIEHAFEVLEIESGIEAIPQGRSTYFFCLKNHNRR